MYANDRQWNLIKDIIIMQCYVHFVLVIITHVDNAMAAQCIVRRERPDCLRCGSIAVISALTIDVIRAVCLFLRLQFPTIEAVCGISRL